MEVAIKTDKLPEKFVEYPNEGELVTLAEGPLKKPVVSPSSPKLQQQQPQQKFKRKHRRGKPKAKNGNKPYKKTNWRFQMPRLNYSKCASAGGSGGCNRREKLQRSRSLVPYNTNKFLMEEHLAEVPSALLTPTGRTRDSSFSMDSEDNYFFSLPEDEEEFLTKEFANVYEKARVERLESLSKQELIEECLQIEDRYSKDQGNQRQQQLNIQRIAQEYMAKIRVLDEKVKDLSRENHNLRCQLMRSAAFAAAAAASPPSAAAPMGAACQPTPMDSSSEDSESDSSTSSSSTSSTSSSSSAEHHQVIGTRSCSSHSSLSEYNGYIENNYMQNNLAEELEAGIEHNRLQRRPPAAAVTENVNEEDFERRQLLDDHMEEEDNVDGDDEYECEENNPKLNSYHRKQHQLLEQLSANLVPNVHIPNESNAGIQNVADIDSSNNDVVEYLENTLT